jgi:hypothetical protein
MGSGSSGEGLCRALCEHPTRLKTNTFARRTSTLSPFLNTTIIRRYRRETCREPILTVIHAPHASQIVAMRYQNRSRQAPFRSGYDNCACATRNTNRGKWISQKASFRTDCDDYTCATRKPNCGKGISPRTRSRSDCDDYTCATRKPNQDRQMTLFLAVPVMHAPHVKSFAVRTCAIWPISRPLKVCALFKRLYEPASSALSGHVSSREDTVWDDPEKRIRLGPLQ